jgi:hypothetical protein
LVLNKAIDIAVSTYTFRTKATTWRPPNQTILRKKFTQSKSRLRKEFSDEELLRCTNFETAWSQAIQKHKARIGTNDYCQLINPIFRRVAADKRPIPPLLGYLDFERECKHQKKKIVPRAPQQFWYVLLVLQLPHVIFAVVVILKLIESLHV